MYQPRAYRAKKSEYKNIFSAPSSRPLIGGSDTTLESQEHGAISELSGPPIRGLELGAGKNIFIYGETVITSEKVFYAQILQKKK